MSFYAVGANIGCKAYFESQFIIKVIFLWLSFLLSILLKFRLSVFLLSEVVLVLLESFCAFLGDREQKMDWIGWDGWSLLVNSFLRAPSVLKDIVLTKIVCSSGLEVVTFFLVMITLKWYLSISKHFLFNMALFEVVFISFFPVIVFRDSNMAVPTH